MIYATDRERVFVGELTEAICDRFGTSTFIVITCRELFQNPDRMFVSLCRYEDYVEGARGVGMLLPVASINRSLEIIQEAFKAREAQP